MNGLVDLRLSELRTKSFAELSQSAGYQHQRIRKGAKTITIAVWTDKISDHELRVVVQAYRYFFLGIGRMAAKGFIIDSTGKIRDLSQQEIYNFL